MVIFFFSLFFSLFIQAVFEVTRLHTLLFIEFMFQPLIGVINEYLFLFVCLSYSFSA